jgi:hypothetical protein
MATVAQLEAALMKADAAGDEAAAREIAAEIKRTRTAKPAKQAPKAGRLESVVSGIERGMQPIAEALDYLNPLSYIGPQKSTQTRNQLARQGARAQQDRPNYFTGGKIAGEIIATAPLIAAGGGAIQAGGKALGTVAPRAGRVLQRVGAATSTGGIGSGRTAAQTAALTKGQRVGQLAERMVGGAIAGGAGAGLTGQDVSQGAAFGAGLPVVGSILGRIGGKAVDLTRLSKVKAGQIIREALGENVEEAAAAFRALSPDDQRLAQQVLVEADVDPSPFFGLGKIATSQMDPDTTRRILEQQATARTERLAEAAGGSTMEDVRAAARGGRAAVTEELAPLREEMYQRAGVASQIVPVAERTARQATQTADEITASGVVPRMRGLEERAGEQAAIMGDNPAIFPDMELIQQTRGISGAAGQRADDAIAAQIELRGASNDLYQMVDDMASQGMRPMRAADLISSLRRKMTDPEILLGSVEERTIKNVIRQLEKATDANGMLNPKALGKIRRSGINEIVNRLSTQMGGVPSRTGTPEAAQGTVLELRSLIDDTLRRGGGGDLVDEFLQKSEQGYAAVNRGELAGEALRLYKQDPKTGAEFLGLTGGDRPKVVGKIMKGGPESEKFRNAFAGDPRRLMALEQSAEELKTLNRMGELASLGEPRAGNILRSQQPGLLSRGLGTLVRAKFPAVAFAGTGAQNVESALVNPNVQREIANAFTSGRSALNAMEQYPTAAQFSEYLSKLPSPVRNAFAQAMRAYGTQNSSNQ